MATAASPTNREKTKEDDKKKKLTKVLSTKLSIDDYNRFEKYTYYAYQTGIIEESSSHGSRDIGNNVCAQALTTLR